MTAATSRDVLAMLRRHYVPDETRPAGIFAPEIGAPDGKRRADLIWQGVTAAAGSGLHGHEIKVSRADVLVELADLTKSDSWQRYCDRWWLVVSDPELVEDLELPASWGVMAPPSGRRTRSMTILQPAPALHPHDQAPALRTLATWLHWRAVRAEAQATQARAERDREASRARDLAARVPHDGRAQSKQVELVDEIVRKLGGPHMLHDNRIGSYDSSVTVDDVVEALSDLGATRMAAQSASWTVQRAARDLQAVLASVDRGQVAKVLEAAKEVDR